MSLFPFLPYSHSFHYPSLFHSYVLSIFSFSPWSLFVLFQFYSMLLVSTCMTRFFFSFPSSSPVSSPRRLVPGPPSTPQDSTASCAPSSQTIAFASSCSSTNPGKDSHLQHSIPRQMPQPTTTLLPCEHAKSPSHQTTRSPIDVPGIHPSGYPATTESSCRLVGSAPRGGHCHAPCAPGTFSIKFTTRRLSPDQPTISSDHPADSRTILPPIDILTP